MTTPESRPNFFILLDLDPNSSWSDAAFHTALLEKKKRWTSLQTGSPDINDRHKAKQFLGMESQIKDVMGDPTKREAERKAAQSILKKTYEEQKKQFDSRLKDVLNKGYITESEIVNLTNTAEAKPLFSSSSALRTHLVSQKIRIQADDASSKTTKIEPLDDAIFGQIQQLLDIVGKENLYEFLGLGRNPTDPQVNDETARLDKDAGQNREHFHVQQAIKDLAGLAKTWMSTSNRQRYDETLRQKKFEKLGKRIRDLARIQGGRIHREQTLGFLKDEVKGLKREEVVTHLRELARRHTITIEGLESGFTDIYDALQSQILCPTCETYNDSKNQKCTTCGINLSIKCPQCGTVNRADHVFCSKCACDLSIVPMLERIIQDARGKIKNRDYTSAVWVLRRAEIRSTDIPKSNVAEETRKLLAGAESELKDQTEAHKAYQDSMTCKLFYTARSQITVYQSKYIPLDDALAATEINTDRKTIDARIAEVEKLVKDAEHSLAKAKLESAEEAASKYQEALQKCPDCEPAKRGLARIPPVPPASLTGKATKNGIELVWKPSPTPNVRYALFRKERQLPDLQSDKLDKPIEVVQQPEHIDSTAPHGIPIYYAVYTDREGVLSLTGAVLNPPVLVTEDVQDLQAVPGDKTVTLTWKPPAHSSHVKIVRAIINQPGSMTPVHTASSSTETKWLDTNVKNDITYQYTVTAFFKDHEGSDKPSLGVKISVTPEPALKPVNDLRLTPSENMVKLEWSKAQRGEVRIVRTTTPLSLNTVLQRDKIESYGVILQGSSELDRAFDSIQPGKTYYTIFTLSRTSAYIGNTVEYFAVNEVENLYSQTEPDRIHLFWNFPPGCEKARVTYTRVMFEGRSAHEKGIEWIEITATSTNEGECYLPISPDADQYIINIQAGYRDEDQVYYSPGKDVLVEVHPSVEITYSFRWRSRWLRQKPRLLLKVKTRRGETKYSLPKLYIECIRYEQSEYIQEIEIDDVGVVSKPIRPIVIQLSPQMRPCHLILKASNPQAVKIYHPPEQKTSFR